MLTQNFKSEPFSLFPSPTPFLSHTHTCTLGRGGSIYACTHALTHTTACLYLSWNNIPHTFKEFSSYTRDEAKVFVLSQRHATAQHQACKQMLHDEKEYVRDEIWTSDLQFSLYLWQACADRYTAGSQAARGPLARNESRSKLTHHLSSSEFFSCNLYDWPLTPRPSRDRKRTSEIRIPTIINCFLNTWPTGISYRLRLLTKKKRLKKATESFNRKKKFFACKLLHAVC